jgi:hypothetical protein
MVGIDSRDNNDGARVHNSRTSNNARSNNNHRGGGGGSNQQASMKALRRLKELMLIRVRLASVRRDPESVLYREIFTFLTVKPAALHLQVRKRRWMFSCKPLFTFLCVLLCVSDGQAAALQLQVRKCRCVSHVFLLTFICFRLCHIYYRSCF